MLIIKVVKRNGKKVDFDGSKIAIAIKKGFDSVDAEYGINDVNKVYNKVMTQIIKLEKDSIKIEQIQDLIEQELHKNGYEDVYKSFAEYRERRAKSREAFSDEKRLHKFLKLIEKLGLKGNSVYNKTAYETMLEFGKTLSKEFSKTYIIKKAYTDANDNGDIYIHNIEFVPMGTIENCQIDFEKLFKNNELENIADYLNYVENVINKVKEEIHGKIIITKFDSYLTPAVLKTFKNELKETIKDLLEISDFDKFVATFGIEREIEKITCIEFDVSIFEKYTREADTLKRIFEISYKKAIEKTQRTVKREIENFLQSIKKQKCIIYFGENKSEEGKIINRSIKEAFSKINAENLKLIEEKEENKNYNKLSTTTINLPRLGLKYREKNLKEFYAELDEKLELVKDQLLERFEEQCSKTASQFPYLIGKGILEDGEKLDKNDKVRRILKQGYMCIGVLGLEECIIALTGKKVQDNEEIGKKIIEHMKEKAEEFSLKYKLNFKVEATLEEEVARQFIELDSAIYGKVKYVTDKECYSLGG